ncbi:MAG: DUF3472 domain-containing protein [Reichenbachiella sp.]|uniref:DUF3472 domain-containing protein n=1 Tax=Reichenbachiella sp. TaxID=2184521 RepID=UPI003264BF8A
MKRTAHLFQLLIFSFSVSLTLSFCTEEDTSASETIDPEEENAETLTLTPNESFFSPVGTLLANQRDKTSGNEYNKNEYYDYIKEWKVLSDTILFGVKIASEGTLQVILEMGIPQSQEGSVVNVYFADKTGEVILKNTGGETTYVPQEKVLFENVAPGFYLVKLKLKSLIDPNQGVGRLTRVHLTGSAVEGAETVMRRYRPKAVHAKWGTESSEPVEISVHELTVMNKTVDCYQPITTPFGYVGSPWSLDTETFSGFNFSLWSYGKNDPVPPFYQESHLIAVGSGLTFGAFGHEGTGVKPRGDHPYIDNDTNTQTIAVRMEPGEVYNTFWSYYLDPSDGHWKLYGCGKKYNKDGLIDGLSTGAFVEVAGPATKQRSGHEIRESRYRGWQMDTLGKWHLINTMEGGTQPNGLSFREWGKVDNKFYMKMGGWGEPDTEATTVILDNPDPLPDFLKGTYLNELYKLPAEFADLDPTGIGANMANVNFEVTDLGTNASVEVFWGIAEGLTKEEKWTQKKSFTVSSGTNTVQVDNLMSKTTYYYRIKITNDQGITWSLDTQKFTTL